MRNKNKAHAEKMGSQKKNNFFVIIIK